MNSPFERKLFEISDVSSEAIKSSLMKLFLLLLKAHDSSIINGNNYDCTFNPIDKILELYERLVQAEKDKVEYLERLMKGSKIYFCNI